MTRLKNAVCLLLICAVYLGAVVPVSIPSFALTHARVSVDDSTKTEERGLQLRLSEGAEQPERESRNNIGQAAPLSDAETQKLLSRLPALKSEDEDEQDFALRERSLPAPRTGRTINASFPPPAASALPEQATSSLLEVARFSPVGEVSLAPNLSVTFSQPMVALTSQAELAAQDVPVRLTPHPRGRWRWVGTKTLLFEPEGRFPMATEYSVTVPAGTKSTGGGALSSTRTWSFSTPPPETKTVYPETEPQRRDTLMFIEFDQKIDPQSVLNAIRVEAGRSQIRTRLATAEEIAADESVSRLSKQAEQGRWLAFRALDANGGTENALPANASVKIIIPPGTPSSEGTRRTKKLQSYSFPTFGLLRVDSHYCGDDGGTCSPFQNWNIRFSNSLDEKAFQKSQVRVEPDLPGLKTEISGSTLELYGLKRGRTTYRVTLDASVRDEFGQTLEKPQTIVFNVGNAPPSLTSNDNSFVLLEPTKSKHFSVYSVNHSSLKVRLYSVTPADWQAFATYMNHAYQVDEGRKPKLPGRLVSSKTIAIKAQPDDMVETRIDLSPALENGLGQVLVIVEPGTPVQKKYRDENSPIEAWVQATNIGLDAFVDRTDLIGWATSLKDGTPLSDVELTIYPSDAKGLTGADGLARLALPLSFDKKLNLLVARRGRDVAILPEHLAFWKTQGSWARIAAQDELRWYVFDDRKLYKPGEEVHIKGWIRRVGTGVAGDIGALDGAAKGIGYTLQDSRGNEILKGTMPINALGGFDTAFKLPGTMNLGRAQLQLKADSSLESGRDYAHDFQVEEFRRPEFAVSAEASEGPHMVGGYATATVSASYYAGGALPSAEVNWTVTSQPGNFTPPNRSDFTFGTWVPWWERGSGDASGHRTQSFTSHTDASGKHHLRIDFDSVNPPRATNVTAEASVMDVNRQTWTAKTSMLVHPADLYVGLRSPRAFVQQGEPLIVESIVTDLDGKAIANADVRLRAVRLDWTYKNGEWQREETNPQECVVKSASDAVKCTFTSAEGGQYRVTASVMDDRERRNESELTLWVAGGKEPPNRDVAQEKVELIPDRKEYKPGDVAEILVQAPFYPAEGVLTLRRSGIVKTERFHMDSSSYTLKIPIDESYLPNIYAQVDLNGATARTDDAGQVDLKLPQRPAFASGSLKLSIPPVSRKLQVTAAPREKALEPGGETTVQVEVKDAFSRPVGQSEVAVVVDV